MKESNLLKGIPAILAVFALGAPALAVADATSGLKGASVKVSYGDLDLEKSEGARILYRRLQQASKQVCDAQGPGDNRSAQDAYEARRCYKDALSDAVAKIDNDLLTQLHAS